MPTYVTLANFTDQGMRDVKNIPKRAEAFKSAAKQFGCTVKELLYTQGQYDVVSIVEAPDEATASALTLSIAKNGNVSGQTLRAFSVAEMEKILAKVV
jgi:uncharacterized protein with GYD domain